MSNQGGREIRFADLPEGKAARLLNKAKVDFDFNALDQDATRLTVSEALTPVTAALLKALVGTKWPRAGLKMAERATFRRLIILQWVMHPDQMPWALGRMQSAREVSEAIGIHKNRVAKIAAEFTRRFGISNAYQRHASNRRGGNGGQAIEDETGSPVGGGKG